GCKRTSLCYVISEQMETGIVLVIYKILRFLSHFCTFRKDVMRCNVLTLLFHIYPFLILTPHIRLLEPNTKFTSVLFFRNNLTRFHINLDRFSRGPRVE